MVDFRMRKFKSIALSLGKMLFVSGVIYFSLRWYGNTENVPLFIAMHALWNTYRDDQQ